MLLFPWGTDYDINTAPAQVIAQVQTLFPRLRLTEDDSPSQTQKGNQSRLVHDIVKGLVQDTVYIGYPRVVLIRYQKPRLPARLMLHRFPRRRQSTSAPVSLPGASSLLDQPSQLKAARPEAETGTNMTGHIPRQQHGTPHIQYLNETESGCGVGGSGLGLGSGLAITALYVFGVAIL